MTQAFCGGFDGSDHQTALPWAHQPGQYGGCHTEQALGLIEGGVDLLLLETCQDILQAKAGLVGIFDALKKSGKNIPVQAQVTLQESGVMLLGTEIGLH